MAFLQLDIDNFQLANVVGDRAEEREAEAGLFINKARCAQSADCPRTVRGRPVRAHARQAETRPPGGCCAAQHPGQVLPDPTDLAIADITLALEFERELYLLTVLEEVASAQRAASGQRVLQETSAAAAQLSLQGAALLQLRRCTLGSASSTLPAFLQVCGWV